MPASSAADPGIDLTLEAIKRFDAATASQAARRHRRRPPSRPRRRHQRPSRRGRDQHPHPPGPAVLPVSVDARRRDHRARAGPASRRRQERHRQRRILSGPLPRGADAARRADARIAVAGGGDSAAAARRRAARTPGSICAASTTRSSAARSCPATGCGSRSRSAAGAASLARAQAVAYVGDQIVAEAELLLGLVPDRTADRSDGDRASQGARSAPGRRSGRSP